MTRIDRYAADGVRRWPTHRVHDIQTWMYAHVAWRLSPTQAETMWHEFSEATEAIEFRTVDDGSLGEFGAWLAEDVQ